MKWSCNQQFKTVLGARDCRIDSLKYCLIVLVIIGHVLSQNQFSSVPLCGVIWKWIYMFHMPLFVFISGYLSHKKKDKRQFLLSCWKIIEPLIIYQILLKGYIFLTTGYFSLKELLTPWWVLWYLLSLLYWRVMLQVIPDRLLSHKKFLVLLAFVVSLIAGYFPFNRFLSIQRTFAFMPFFVLGYSMRGKNLFVASRYRVWCALFLVITIILPLYFENYLGDLNQADPYTNPSGIFSRLLVFGLSIPMSISFMNLCPVRHWIVQQGRLTMQYYIFHAVIIFLFMKCVNLYNLPTTFFAAMVYSFGLVLGIWLLCKIPFIVKLTNPSSFFKVLN